MATNMEVGLNRVGGRFLWGGLNNYLPVDWDEQTFKNTEMTSKTRNNHKLVERSIVINDIE